MPMYEYACRACQERFELFRPISERDETATCPRCGETREHLRVPAAVLGQPTGRGAGCGTSPGSGFR